MSRQSVHRARGFSLIEVMVALIIVSVGLLGIAKMQALAYASTGTAALRSLASIQAASLASTMHANRAYWSTGVAPGTITLAGNTITSADPALSAATDCTTGGAAPCTASAVAAYDLQSWAVALQALLPNYQAIITCTTVAIPVTCVATITWTEHSTAVNKQAAAAATAALAAGTPPAMQLPSYTLYIEP